ncbi:MAG: glycoside hydrolase domain-containing protein [Verrucomicrobiota bacterium]
MKGLSTNKRCTSSSVCLNTNGIEFVIRYYSETTQQAEKHLTPAEARAILQAGLSLAVVYQDRQDQAADFNRPAGHRDGTFAWQYARESAQPLGTTIFFAVDYDADPADLNQIKAYFQGVAAGLAQASGQAAPYRIGVYGSGYICKRLHDAGLVVHTWLSESTGHRESATYTGWNVKQIRTAQILCGLPARSWQRCESQGADTSWCFSSAGGGAAPDNDPGPLPQDNAEPVLRRGGNGPSVLTLQRLLNRWLAGESAGHILEDGDFGPRTQTALKAFQSSHIDAFGRPLEADGICGGLTWGALKRLASGAPDPAGNPIILPGASATWWKTMPAAAHGGTARGLAALRSAVGEAAAGRGESGGNNRGPDVEKYLHGLVDMPANWCAGFVCWCLDASGGMPFNYTVGARSILSRARSAGLTTFTDPLATAPLPGDIVVWWRVRLSSWEGHTGYVHHVEGGRIYTIEGNKTSRVEGFDYSLVGMRQLLGFVRL